ncbi:MAG: Asp23/Gls24 family envelope stress response protein [Clostridia bacterium]|nr:Asp23/Gls24 family envelope stress response protein [Clostridia bacterium]
MKIYALVGVSGTGKSHQALNVAINEGIHFIIDDGLLIYERKKVAGYSAKKERTYMGAVKRAIFLDSEHRNEVSEALALYAPDKLLIIGTSTRMVERIAQRLGLHGIDQFIQIEEVSTEEDIRLARFYRDTQGKHVIPLPTVEVKKDFSGYFQDTLKLLIPNRFLNKDHIVEEKTVIRPTFSYLGNYTISNKTIVDIVKYSGSMVKGVSTITRVKTEGNDDLIIDIECGFILGSRIHIVAKEAQKAIKMAVEEMTQLNVKAINLTVKILT